MAGRFGDLGQEVSRRVWRPALAALFPHFCLVCGQEGRLLCQDCQYSEGARLTGVFCCPVCRSKTAFGTVCPSCRHRTALDGSVAAAPYGLPLWRSLLRVWKYEGVDEAGEDIEDVFRGFCLARGPTLRALFQGAAFLPVPLHWYREARRGFNQSGPLARVAADAAGCRLAGGVLVRNWSWTHQAALPAGPRRRSNVARSFRVRAGTAIPERVVLVDDVLTTGSTLDACARVLKAAGARSVWAVTFLRG